MATTAAAASSASKPARRRTARSQQLASDAYPASSSGANSTGQFVGFDDGACIEGHDLTSLLRQFVEVVAVEALAELNAINEDPSSLSLLSSSSAVITTAGAGAISTTTTSITAGASSSASDASSRKPLELDHDIEYQSSTPLLSSLPGRWSCRVRRAAGRDDDDDDNVIEVVTSKPVPATSEAEAQQGAVWRARLLLVAASALYGTNFALVKLMGDVMPVGISTPLRFGMAALAALPWLIEKNEPIEGDDTRRGHARHAAMLGFEVGLWNAAGHIAQAVGLETTLASKSAFICSLAVVVVPLIDSLNGRRILPRQWVGVAMAVVGVAFLELGGNDGIAAAISSLTMGDALSFVQPVMFGIGFSRMERAMHLYPDQAPRMTAAQLMAIFVASLGYGLWWAAGSGAGVDAGGDAAQTIVSTIQSYPWQQWLTDPSTMFSLFWTGCIATALTIYMENMALESLSAAETTLIFSTEPLWGTAFAAAIMGEEMGVNAGVGAVFILTACLYSNLGVEGFRKMLHTALFCRNKNTQPQDSSSKHQQQQQQQQLSSKKSLWLTLRNRKGWSLLPSGLASSLATWNVVADVKTQEGIEIVDELMESLVDKLS